jgi:hypothetical protein
VELDVRSSSSQPKVMFLQKSKEKEPNHFASIP